MCAAPCLPPPGLRRRNPEDPAIKNHFHSKYSGCCKNQDQQNPCKKKPNKKYKPVCLQTPESELLRASLRPRAPGRFCNAIAGNVWWCQALGPCQVRTMAHVRSGPWPMSGQALGPCQVVVRGDECISITAYAEDSHLIVLSVSLFQAKSEIALFSKFLLEAPARSPQSAWHRKSR